MDAAASIGVGCFFFFSTTTTPAWVLDNYKPGSWRLLTTSRWAALWTSTPLGYQEEALGAPI
eukprot:scaffold1023_cov94-Isochrysis_galbana.AAC.1